MARTGTGKSKAKAEPTRKAGNKDHVVGSRKGRVHEAYDKQGTNAAHALGVKLGLRESTLRTWMAAWRRADAKAAKATARKTAKAA